MKLLIVRKLNMKIEIYKRYCLFVVYCIVIHLFLPYIYKDLFMIREKDAFINDWEAILCNYGYLDFLAWMAAAAWLVYIVLRFCQWRFNLKVKTQNEPPHIITKCRHWCEYILCFYFFQWLLPGFYESVYPDNREALENAWFAFISKDNYNTVLVFIVILSCIFRVAFKRYEKKIKTSTIA